MKKILISLAIITIFLPNSAFAQGFSEPLLIQNSNCLSVVQNNISSHPYMKFYNVNSENLTVNLKSLNKEEEKNLTKDEKKNYKDLKKIQKWISQNKWGTIFEKYPNCFPAYVEYYNYFYDARDYQSALPILVKISDMNRRYQIFDDNTINYNLANLYFYNSQYSSALNYFKTFEPTTDRNIITNLAVCNFYLQNYNATIDYFKRVSNLEYPDKELLFESNYALNKISEANKYAKELLQLQYSYKNLMRVVNTTSNLSVKLDYAYKARKLARTSSEILMSNRIIAEIEQNKLEKRVSNYTQFVKIPNWQQIQNEFPKNIQPSEISLKQDEFFRNANFYITRYKGQQLTNAFNSLNQDLTNYTKIKQNEYYQEKQLQAQKTLIEEQQRQNALQQQLIYERQVQNMLDRQRMYYYMYRPYYYGHYGWW